MSNKRHSHTRPRYPLLPISPNNQALAKRAIAAGQDEKREYYLHPTKGYRSSRKLKAD